MFGGASWPLFRLFGIQVVTNWTIILLFLVGGTPAGALAIILSVLIHEFGHALTAKSKGAYIDQVVIGFVGLASFSGRLTSSQRALIAFAGPLVNLICFMVFVNFAPSWSFKTMFHVPSTSMPFFEQFAFEMATWGIILGVFNLIPALPMDGGWVFQHLLETKVPENQARITALKLTVAVSVGFIVIAILVPKGFPLSPLMLFIFGAIFFFMAFTELKARQILSSGPGIFESFFNQQKEKRQQKQEQQKQENEMQVRAKIDQLLVKISNEGMASLTEEERNYLTKNSKQYPKS